MSSHRKLDIQFLLNRGTDEAAAPPPLPPAPPLPLLHPPSSHSLPPPRTVDVAPPPLPPPLLPHYYASPLRGVSPSGPYYRNPLWATLGQPAQLSEPMFSTRRKLADPKTSAHDPELSKRRYLCNFLECGCRFKQRGDLKKHVRVVHHNERKFICKTCNKSFGERGNLNKHIMSVHKKLRPFSCRLCTSAYASADSLRRHERSHQRRTLMANII